MCRQHRRVKVKDYIILNPGAHSFQASEQLHTRSAHSIFAKHQLKMQNESTCHRGKQERDKLGDMLEDAGRRAGRQVRRQALHPTKRHNKGEKLEDKLGGKLGDKLETRETRPRDGRHAIQQRETKRKTS